MSSTTDSATTFEDVTVQLTGEDGNAFAILARCEQAIKQEHGADAAARWMAKAQESESYDALLRFCMTTLDVQ